MTKSEAFHQWWEGLDEEVKTLSSYALMYSAFLAGSCWEIRKIHEDKLADSSWLLQEQAE